MSPLLADIEKVATVPTSVDELIAISAVAVAPTFIGPLPIFIDLLRRNGMPSFVPYFVLGFWTLAATVPMALTGFGILDRGKMMYGDYPVWAQVILAPSLLFPLFFFSAYLFALLFGVRQERIFALAFLPLGLLMLGPWLAFAFYGI